MATAYVGRLIVAAPVAGGKNATVAAWIDANLGEGANAVPADLGPGLAAATDGTNTVVYKWCDVALTTADTKAVIVKLCQLAGVAVPTAQQWDNATWAQRVAWWNTVRDAVFSNYGVWCQLMANDGAWDDPAACLALRGWKSV